MESDGVGKRKWEGIGRVQVGVVVERRPRRKYKVFLSCVRLLGVELAKGGRLNSGLGPLAKASMNLTWQPHEVAWQEESCI